MRRESHVRFCEGGGVRFPSATRLLVGFQHKSEAEQFLADLRERFQKFHLELHPDKTRLLEFGPFCGRTTPAWRTGQARDVQLPRLHAHLREEEERTVHGAAADDAEQVAGEAEGGQNRASATLARPDSCGGPVAALGGQRALPVLRRAHEHPSPVGVRSQIGRLWHRALSRRSHKGRITWERMYRLMNHWLPPVRVCHPYPLRRMGVIT